MPLWVSSACPTGLPQKNLGWHSIARVSPSTHGARQGCTCRTNPPPNTASIPHVTQSEIQPGDLVFYKTPIGHVAIYIGGGSMIHAPSPGDVVQIAAVNWAKVVGIGRPG